MSEFLFNDGVLCAVILMLKYFPTLYPTLKYNYK